jgi:TolB protein
VPAAPPPGGLAIPPAQPRLPDEFEPTWSPDGTRISYITRGAGTRARIWVTDVKSGASAALTSGEHSDEAPTWSPDGRYLAFSSNRAGDPEIYLMRADGTGQTRLTRAKGSDWLPRWIPPGRNLQR